ncbi:3-dehydroquinate synthase [Laceyella putida]|uniref:3-dehydroquinate synthase n=1 Tax=Laceyella putida TaxID=110101 RepID=A0ABW2RME5_9BACL
MKTLLVDVAGHRYPIRIGQGTHQLLPQLLTENGIGKERMLMLISDSHVAPLYGLPMQASLQAAGYQVGLSVIPPGEESKKLSVVEQVIGDCLRFGLDRSSLVLALGGGVVGDLAGFVAATYMRGIPFIQLPTTLLAHDSSVGGKVGVNHALGKNFIGAFHQPLMVVFDVDVLASLPAREVVSGLAEVAKHALIWDVSFVEWLEAHAEALLALDPERMTEAIYRGCEIKSAIVSQDEKELGIRAILNYGHTIGHALEAVSAYQRYTHGEAIAIGMAGAARLSVRLLGAPEMLVHRTEQLLHRLRLPIRYTEDWPQQALLDAMKKDKKVRGGHYAFVLAKQLGQVELVRGIAEDQITQVLKEIHA